MVVNNTVVVDITVNYRNKTGNGPQNTAKDVDKITKAVKEADGASEKATSSIQKIGTALKNIAHKAITVPVKVADYATRSLRGILDFGTKVKGFFTGQQWQVVVSNPIGLADQYTKDLTGFQTKLNDNGKGQKMMDDIDGLVANTPLKPSNAVTQSKKMLDLGWAPEDVAKDIETIGDASAALGKGQEGLESIASVLAQIRSNGKLSTEEINQLAKAGINAEKYLAESLGLGTEQSDIKALTDAINSNSNPISGDFAVESILAGMNRDYDGMMNKMSMQTVSGLKSNLEDTFEVSIIRKWGQGLQEGAVKGLSTLVDFLNKNSDKLNKLGDIAKNFASTMSVGVVDALQGVINKLLEITDTKAFKDADFFGKVKILWDEIVWNPFMKWWDGEGGAKFKSKAQEIGKEIGEFLVDGIGFAFKEILPNILGSAGKILPGGEKPDAMSYASTGAIMYGGYKGYKAVSPVVKGAKSIIGKATTAGTAAKAAGAVGSGATATAGLSALSKTGIGGAVVGTLGLVSAANDLIAATSSRNEKERSVKGWSAATKTSSVAVGTAIGAAVGSIIPGLGTVIGAGIGAGVGGIVALTTGDKLGKGISDMIDGTGKTRELTDNLVSAVGTFEQIKRKTDDGKVAIDKYRASTKELNDMMRDTNGAAGNTDMYKTVVDDQKKAVQDLIDLYPDLIGWYDFENGRLEEKLRLIENISANDRETARTNAEMALVEYENNLPEKQEQLKEAKEQKESDQNKFYASGDWSSKVALLEADVYTLYDDPNIDKKSPEYATKKADFKKRSDELNKFAYDNGLSGVKNFLPFSLYGKRDKFGFGKRTNSAANLAKAEPEGWADSYNKSSEDYEEKKRESDEAYQAAVTVAKNPVQKIDGYTVDVEKMEANIEQISAYAVQIEEKQKKLDEAKAKYLSDNKGKTEADFKESDQYKLMQDGVDQTKGKQEVLQKEVEKFRHELEKVVKKLEEVNEKYTDIDPEKQVTLKVVTDYLEESSQPEKIEQDTYIPGEGVKVKGGRMLEIFAKGTGGAPNGYALVGERGPEIVKFNGGERVYTAEQSRSMISKWNKDHSVSYASGAVNGLSLQGGSFDIADVVNNAIVTRQDASASGAPTAHIDSVTINVASKDGESSVEALKRDIVPIANEIVGTVALQLTKSWANMPRTAKGVC